MHRPTFLGRSLSHLRLTEPTTHTHRIFSTTPTRFFPDDSSNPEPNSRQRAAAAAAAAGTLPSRQSAAAANTQSNAPQPINQLARGGVISLKSLPGRGGPKFPGPNSVSGPRFLIRREAIDSPTRGGNGFSRGGLTRGGGDERGRGGLRGRGRGGRGRGRGMRGRGRGRGRGGRDRSDDKEDDIDEEEDEDGSMPAWTPEGGAYIDALEDGFPKIYTPKMTALDLEGYGPAVASTGTTNKAGRTAAVYKNMRLLGGGVPFCSDVINTEVMMEAAREGKAAWFDTLGEREFARQEDGSEYPGPGEGTKEAILDASLRGTYDVVKAGDGVKDVEVTMRRYMNKIPGYRPKDVEASLGKMKELLR